MAPPPSKTTGTSPYGFGLKAIYLSFIPPLFYFLSKTLEGIFFPAQPFDPVPANKSNLLRPAPLNTCSLTEPEEPFIYIDHNWTKEAAQALLAFLFVIFLCGTALDEAKWNRSSAKARWAYHLEWFKRFNDQSFDDNTDDYFRESIAAIPHMVPSHNDYRISQRREKTKLLFLVAISVCLCPIAEYLFCARETVSERLYKHVLDSTGGETHGAFPKGFFMIYLVFRYGTLPCVLTGLTSAILTNNIFHKWHENAAKGFWDRWIEKWIKAHQMENAAAEAKWMAEMNVIEPGDGNLYVYFPEQNFKAQMYSD